MSFYHSRMDRYLAEMPHYPLHGVLIAVSPERAEAVQPRCLIESIESRNDINSGGKNAGHLGRNTCTIQIIAILLHLGIFPRRQHRCKTPSK